MDNKPREVKHGEIPVPKPPEGWTLPPDPTPEELREEALARLAKIDQCRAIEALIRDGWDDERIAANQGVDVRTVRVVSQPGRILQGGLSRGVDTQPRPLHQQRLHPHPQYCLILIPACL